MDKDELRIRDPGDPRRTAHRRATGAVTFQIYQTSTYGQETPGVNKGYVYARTGNPGRTALEECLASLEDAQFCYTASSGMAAINNILCLLQAGDHVVTCQDLYGGAYRMFTKLYSKFGVKFSFVDATNLDVIEKAFTPQTKMLWLETPSNPLLGITDIAAVAGVARQAGARLVVDNTFASPYLQAPLKLGADIVMHSTTKYLNGHSDVLGGASITNDPALARAAQVLPERRGRRPGPDGLLPQPARHQDAAGPHGPPLRQCAPDRRVLLEAPEDRQGLLPRPPLAPRPRDRQAPDARLRRHGLDRAPGRHRGDPQVHVLTSAVDARREPGRREVAPLPARHDDPRVRRPEPCAGRWASTTD